VGSRLPIGGKLPVIRPEQRQRILLWQQGSHRLARVEADRGGNIEVFQNIKPALAQLVYLAT